MVIGIVVWELEIFGAQSLKDKRRVVKSLKDRLHRQLNVSVAETAHQDLWQRAELTAAVAAGDRRHADSVLSSADAIVGRELEWRVIGTWRTFH